MQFQKIKSRKQKNSGISLLEVMLSLTIIAIILVMATRYFGIARHSSQLNVATSQIGEIKQGYIRYQQDNNAYDTDLATLATDGYITKQTASGVDPWGGNYTPDVAANPPQLAISGTGEDCVALAARFSDGACDGKGTVTVNLLQ